MSHDARQAVIMFIINIAIMQSNVTKQLFLTLGFDFVLQWMVEL